jgi:histidine triad (HIT) family protein
MSCIFCKIVKGEAAASFLYQDTICSAFLDIHPINTGHVLVVTYQHASSVTRENLNQIAKILSENIPPIMEKN